MTMYRRVIYEIFDSWRSYSEQCTNSCLLSFWILIDAHDVEKERFSLAWKKAPKLWVTNALLIYLCFDPLSLKNILQLFMFLDTFSV